MDTASSLRPNCSEKQAFHPAAAAAAADNINIIISHLHSSIDIV